jgi:hypothetical protein
MSRCDNAAEVTQIISSLLQLCLANAELVSPSVCSPGLS